MVGWSSRRVFSLVGDFLWFCCCTDVDPNSFKVDAVLEDADIASDEGVIS